MSAQTSPEQRLVQLVLDGADAPFAADDQDSIYAVGRTLYERGDYVNAAHVSRLLALVAPRRSRSWTTLAACHDALGDAERARALYGLALTVDEHDLHRPFAALHKARLDIECGELEVAELGLDQLGDVDPELAPLEADVRRRIDLARGRS